MKIYRNGQEIELTWEEMEACSEELARLKKEQQEAQEKKQREEEWEKEKIIKANFRIEGRRKSYPENVLLKLTECVFTPYLYQYVVAADDEKADKLKGLEWAIDNLPETHRIAVQSYYRDKMKIREIAEKLGLTYNQARLILDKAILMLRGKRLEPFLYGYEKYCNE